MNAYEKVCRDNQALQRQLRDALAERDALAAKVADAWDEGAYAGWSDRNRSVAAAFRGEPGPGSTPNPYRTDSHA